MSDEMAGQVAMTTETLAVIAVLILVVMSFVAMIWILAEQVVHLRRDVLYACARGARKVARSQPGKPDVIPKVCSGDHYSVRMGRGEWWCASCGEIVDPPEDHLTPLELDMRDMGEEFVPRT